MRVGSLPPGNSLTWRRNSWSENRETETLQSGDRDSSPPNWLESLDEPLDSRHPARHNIWTPVLEGIQRQVFLGDRRRVDDSRLYVRNAVHFQEDKPPATMWIGIEALGEMEEFGRLVGIYGPILVLTFGAFAFEFARRSLGGDPRRRFSYWTTKRLGAGVQTDRRRIQSPRAKRLPLLHVSIALHFLTSHEHFTGESKGNYFDFVGREVGTLLLEYKDTLDVWVEPQPATR